MGQLLAASAALLVLVATATASAAPVDLQTLDQIADAGFNHGEAVETAEYLSDQIGARLTNSPSMRKAEAWAQKRFAGMGLKNVHAEGFEFGRGWWVEAAHVRMVAPRPLDLAAIPVAWSPPTNGAVTAPIVLAPIRSEADFAQYHGKLKGRIVLSTPPSAPRDQVEPPFERFTDADLAKMDAYTEPHYDPDLAMRRAEIYALGKKLDDFLAAEGAVARLGKSRSDARRLHGEGSGYRVADPPKIPAFEVGAEDYSRLVRLASVGEVKVELESRVHYEGADTKAYNILAELPGTDPRAGFVMAGAHLDSWVAGDGAADNGAGVAVVMEAARILSSLGLHPKRSIRFALWSAEEQGLLGSTAYVATHFAHRPPGVGPAPPYMANTYPIATLPEYGQMHGYFNLDMGSGKIRGVYAEGNFAAMPMLKEWLAPLAPLGVYGPVAGATGSTDHVGMVRVGLPAFQFVQDPLDYDSRVHHTDLDTFDHLRPDDLRQAAVVLASVLLDAAESDVPLPGNALPTEPRSTDPFTVPDETPIVPIR